MVVCITITLKTQMAPWQEEGVGARFKVLKIPDEDGDMSRVTDSVEEEDSFDA